MLITEFHPTLARILQLPKSKRPNKHPSPTQSKVWTSVKSTVRLYLGALLKVSYIDFYNFIIKSVPFVVLNNSIG